MTATPATSPSPSAAATRTPLLQVSVGGDCLNLRAAASTDARVLACLADGTLLEHDPGTTAGAPAGWAAVRTLDGTAGFASSDDVAPLTGHPALPALTGLADVDPIVEAVRAGDVDALLAHVRYTRRPCSDQPSYGLRCAALGVPSGTEFDVISVGNCDVGTVTADGVAEFARSFFGPQGATTFVGAFDTPAGERVALFAVGARGNAGAAAPMGVFLHDGGIVQLGGFCGQMPGAGWIDHWLVRPEQLGYDVTSGQAR